jgi:hypothetical protein
MEFITEGNFTVTTIATILSFIITATEKLVLLKLVPQRWEGGRGTSLPRERKLSTAQL